MDAVDKLKRMVGSEFFHNNNRIKVLDYNVKNGAIVIITDKDELTCEFTHLNEFLNEFEAVDQTIKYNAIQPTKQAQKLELSVMNSAVAAEIKDTLLENIRKVKTDKDYIPQAEAINVQVKSLIDLAKVEIDMIKTVNSINGLN